MEQKWDTFFADRLNWLGVEIGGFNTTPHIKESSFSTSSHLRVTTLAFNAIATGQDDVRFRRLKTF
jgi:hypothetical protein